MMKLCRHIRTVDGFLPSFRRRLRIILGVLTLLVLAACVPSGPSASSPSLVGQAMLDGRPQAGVTVLAWPVETAQLAGEAPYGSTPSLQNGHFSLALPAGRYYLLARGAGVFAYYGRNPVTVSSAAPEEINIGLIRLPTGSVPGEPFVASGVLAQVSAEGEPLAGATLYAYLDLNAELKGMGYVMAGPSDEDGLVEAELPAGTYYLLARKRQGGQGYGPVRAGDFVGYYPGNPVRIEPGEVARLQLPLLEVPAKVDRLQATLFGGTSLQGVIVDAGGEPVSGARAVVYRDPQMLNRPLAVSQPTGDDGTFVVSLAEGGVYFLAGRNTLGGAPGPGELYGTYDGTPDHSLQLETGTRLKNLKIKVEEMW